MCIGFSNDIFYRIIYIFFVRSQKSEEEEEKFRRRLKLRDRMYCFSMSLSLLFLDGRTRRRGDAFNILCSGAPESRILCIVPATDMYEVPLFREK